MDDELAEELTRFQDAPRSHADKIEDATTEYSYLAGKAQGVFDHGLEAWIAHDSALIHTTTRRTGEDLKVVKMTTDFILWHDVRDVEVGFEAFIYEGSYSREWSILIQYPRLSMKQSGDDFRDFCVAVARLAAEHH